MKDFYFMRKPEVLEKEEYENPDKRMVFHYRHGERRYNIDRQVIKEERSENLKHRRTVRRRIIYVLDIFLILGILGYFFWSQKDKLDNAFVDKLGIKYYFRLVSHNNRDKEIIIYVENTTKKPIKLAKAYSIQIYKLYEESKKELLDNKILSAEQELSKYNSILLYSFRFTMDHNIKSIIIVINDNISLSHKFSH